MNLIQTLNQEQMDKLAGQRKVPAFDPGDTLKVHVKVTEGDRERIQVFEGLCIARKNSGINSSFTVRKISYGEGVERVFPLYSPRIDEIEVVRKGIVRRAKLYYLRGRTGKSARIVEDIEAQRELLALQAKEAASGEKKAKREKPKTSDRPKKDKKPAAKGGKK